MNHGKHINKRIIREKIEKKKGCIGILIMLLIFSSPLWFYRGIMHEIVLPIWGEKSKAVLSGTMRPRPWSGFLIILILFIKTGNYIEKIQPFQLKILCIT